MIAPTVSPSQPTDSGYWRVFVNPTPSNSTAAQVDVTIFRNIPTTVENLSTTDPFGPASATISFGGITLLDSIGVADLNWLVPEANVDIVWMSPQIDISSAPIWKGNAQAYAQGDIVQYAQDYYENISAVTSNTIPSTDITHWQKFNPSGEPLYTWEGYFVSFEFGEEDAGSTLTVQCNGAMKQMDNYLAYPEYLTAPMSYEYAIERQFDKRRRRDSRMTECVPFKETATKDPKFAFMANDPTYIFNKNNYAINSTDAIYKPYATAYFTPTALQDGDIFTGMLTRSTGNFDPVLSTYIQNLLSSMQTASGSISLMLAKGRKPYFKHRVRLTQPENTTLYVDLLWPGVKISLTQDFTQKINVVYGKGKALNGDNFSNLVYDDDGSKAHFEPFAAKAENYPASSTNSSFDANLMSKEVQLNFYDGLNAGDAAIVAKKTLDVYSDPGITGQITLTTDPKLEDGTGYARQKISAGMTILVQGLFGNRNGTLFHITEQSFSNEGNTVSLTIDSKYRDQLTVQEVRKRGKDSLVVSQLLGLGKYQPSIDDLLFPWSYELGSGYVPTNAKDLWSQASTDQKSSGNFPWLGISKNYPPSGSNPSGSGSNSSAGNYAVIKKASLTNANENWSAAVPVVFSAKGNINSVRFAAYKADGSPYLVPFHVSLWYEDAINPSNMPQLPQNSETLLTNNDGYALSAVLRIPNTPNAAGTVPATLKFSKNAKDELASLAGTAFPIKIKDSKYIKKASQKWYSGVTVNKKKLTISWRMPQADATYLYSKKGYLLKQTVSQIYLKPSSSTPAGAGLIPAGFSYGWGQNYPFFKGAWESTNPDGSKATNDNASGTNTPIAGWGNHYEQAGYFPNSGGNADTIVPNPPTGQFVDDTVFSYDMMSGRGEIDPQGTPAANVAANPSKSHVTGYAMFYCDQEWDGSKLVPRKEAVYFLGRLYRQPPGA